MSFGEQYCESAWQGRPLVTLWPPRAHVHRTVSPTEMLTVSGTNWKPFPPPTVTLTVVPVGDGTPFTAGWPFSSRMRMGGALFVFGIFVCLSPDSARTKNTMANTIPIQKIARTAFDLFIVLFLLPRASVPSFCSTSRPNPPLTLSDSVSGILRSSFQKRQAESLSETRRNLSNLHKKR